VCGHVQLEEIEDAFIRWRCRGPLPKNTAWQDRTSVYRHAHALGLFAKRQRNIKGCPGADY
jgi:hypothetical protein